MTSHHPSEIESNAADSVTSSPRSDCPQYDLQSRVRFMCSFGGQILPRPHDNQLRYVGGDTRIVAVHRSSSFSSLLVKLSKLSGYTDITVKYQLPNEDLDALITVTTDEDVENMMEEYDRLVLGGNPKTARLRLFLFTTGGGGGGGSTASSISSLLEGSRREHWFFDALNGGSASAASLDRGRSEVSSILSEVPDYLFGLDTMDENREPKLKNRHMLGDNVSVSDPGSPAPVVSPSPYCSTSSIPDLPPVKTKIENPNSNPPVMEQTQSENHSMTGEQFMTHQPGGYPGNNNMWHHYSPSPETHYVTDPQAQYTNPSPLQPMPVYYVPGPVPGSNIPVQVQRVPVQSLQTVQSPYVQRIPVPMPVGQVPVSYQQHVQNVGQVYGGGMRPVSAVEMMQDGGVSQAVYYGGRNAGMVPGYQPTVYPVGAEMQGGGSTEKMMGKMNPPH